MEKQHVTRIERHLDELEAEITVLRTQLRAIREAERQEEEDTGRKRIHKLGDKITTELRDVVLSRGGCEDEADLLQQQQPHVFDIMDDTSIAKRLRSRAMRINTNMRRI